MAGILIVGAVLLIGGWWYVELNNAPMILGELVATSTPSEVLPYGVATLSMGERAIFKGVTIRPLSVEEDSRCPTGVQCIQAGTVRVKVEIVSGLGTSTPIIGLGKSITTEAEVITLTATTPHPARDVSIVPNEYRFIFTVAKRTVAGCFIGGCSSQICSDQPDVVSSCEYRSEYACYQKATCERQKSGACGWTQTAELKSCLLSPPSL